MATHVDFCIMEVVHAATGVDFELEETTKERLRLPARMKGGGIKRATDTRYSAFLGALLVISPRCIEMRDGHGKLHPGYYSQQLTLTIGRGAHDSGGQRNARFLQSREVGPYPEACGKEWTHTRQEAMENYELREGSGQEEWMKIGSLKNPTPTNARNNGATDWRGKERNGEDEHVTEEGREVQQRMGPEPGRERPEEREVDAWSEASE